MIGGITSERRVVCSGDGYTGVSVDRRVDWVKDVEYGGGRPQSRMMNLVKDGMHRVGVT